MRHIFWALVVVLGLGWFGLSVERVYAGGCLASSYPGGPDLDCDSNGVCHSGGSCCAAVGNCDTDCSNDGVTNRCGGSEAVCPSGTYLKCGLKDPSQGFFCPTSSSQCYDGAFPSDFTTSSLCGGNTCMQNCSCCAPGTVRSCNVSSTYTYDAGYIVGAGQGQGGGGPAQWACANYNDEWLSGVTANWAAGGDCVEDADGIRFCRRTNTCRSCGCEPVSPPSTPACVVQGPLMVKTTDSPVYQITSSFATVDSTMILKSPTSPTNPGGDWGVAPYVCTSTGNPVNCSGSTTFPVAGTYWVVCNAYASGNDPKCSGNPFGLPLGWTDCGASSRIAVTACSTTPPTNLNIVAGSDPATTAQVTWTPGTGAPGTTTQYLWVDEDLVEVNAGCPTPGDCEASRALTGSDGSELVTGLLPLTTYSFRVMTYLNNVCQSDVVGTYTTPPDTGIISGTVYLDTDNACSNAVTMDNVSVVMDSTTTDVTGPAGGFNFTALKNVTHSLATSMPSGYMCSTKVGCNACSKSGVISPSSNSYFYLTTARGPWWQVQGAGVYAGGTSGTTIQSDIPSSIPLENRYLVLAGDAAVIRASSSLPSLGDGTVNSQSLSARSTYHGKKAGYDFFANPMGVLPGQVARWGATLDQGSCTAGEDFCYGPGTTISSAWNVTSGQKYVVIVNGNLRINADIAVANGGFLAFIVNGSVIVDPSVIQVQGLYVMDDNFVTETGGTDNLLNVAGSVVAWGSVQLNRDLGSGATGNIANPAEMFVYRSDLLTNMPDKMKTFAMQWQEVAAGTFGQ